MAQELTTLREVIFDPQAQMDGMVTVRGQVAFLDLGMDRMDISEDGAKLIVRLSRLEDPHRSLLTPETTTVEVTGNVKKEQRRTFLDATAVRVCGPPDPPTAAPAVHDVSTRALAWLDSHPEDHVCASTANLNQYWYSTATISTIVAVVREHCLPSGPCAFISTPSIFFTLEPSERASSRVLDLDEDLGRDEPGFVRYDFNEPTSTLPAQLKGAFSSVVIDPPFITEEVWLKYIETAKHLLVPQGGLVLLTTVIENADLLQAELGATPHRFLPSIPNLPYQYALYTNFATERLAAPNPEVPHDPDSFLAGARASSGTREAEAPLRGKGASYDFEAMIEAELKRQGGQS